MSLRFLLESEKTPKQCIKAIAERMEQSATKTRPALVGWTDKDSGRFYFAMETQVFWRFKRRTRLRGQAIRERGTTLIQGFVPHGLPRTQVIVVSVFVVALTLFMFVRGQLIYALMIVLAGGFMAIPLIGDYQNHDRLLYELEKATKAKPRKP